MNVPEKHREIARAWVDGAEIEYFSQFEECWEPKKHGYWDEYTQYRVKPATPHSIDWSHVAKHINAMVGCPSGQVILVPKEPIKIAKGWIVDDYAETANAEDFASFKRGTIDWKDSLVLRPMEAAKTLTKEQWAKIPAEFNFAAADYDGEWYAFITEPNRRTSCWKAKDEPYHGFKPGDVGTLPNAPWEDSLCKRPE